MSDIVERLRSTVIAPYADQLEAADEIERLRRIVRDLVACGGHNVLMESDRPLFEALVAEFDPELDETTPCTS